MMIGIGNSVYLAESAFRGGGWEGWGGRMGGVGGEDGRGRGEGGACSNENDIVKINIYLLALVDMLQ